MKKLIFPVLALILPFFIWPIETFLPYPAFIEELAKAVLIIFLIRENPSFNEGLKLSLLLGAFFALTETVLYLINLALVGDVGTFLLRLILTTFLHSFTAALFFTFAFSRKFYLIFFGLATVMIIHFLFNYAVPFFIIRLPLL